MIAAPLSGIADVLNDPDVEDVGDVNAYESLRILPSSVIESIVTSSLQMCDCH